MQGSLRMLPSGARPAPQATRKSRPASIAVQRRFFQCLRPNSRAGAAFSLEIKVCASGLAWKDQPRAATANRGEEAPQMDWTVVAIVGILAVMALGALMRSKNRNDVN